MEVVINIVDGGFGLSDKAVERCIELGMTSSTALSDDNADFYQRKVEHVKENYHIREGWRKEFRTNPILIQVVKEIGDKANGSHSMLKIIDIPFNDLEGWHIDEDGYGSETIEEDHRSWS